MNSENRTNKHWIVLVCVSLMFAVSAGIINNVIGVFYTPVSESLGLSVGDFALHATLTQVAVGVVSLFVPQLIYRFGWKKTLIVGVFCAFAGTAGMALGSQLWLFYILGAVRGVGGALLGMVPMTMFLNNWFYEKNGLAISLASAFSGVIGVIFAPIFSNVIANFDWRIGFVAMGVSVIVLALPAILISYSLNPEEEELKPYGAEETSYKKNNSQETEDSGERNGVSLKTMSVSFVAMIIFSFLHTNILGMNQHLSSYGASIGMSVQMSGYMLSAVMVGNITFKLLLGPLSDKIGALKSTVIFNGVNVLGLIMLITLKAPFPAIMAAFLFGSAFSVGSVALPLLSKQFFGRQLSERVFPILTFISSAGVAVANTAVGYIFDATGSYEAAFIIGIGFQLINIVMLLIAYKYSLSKLKTKETREAQEAQ